MDTRTQKTSLGTKLSIFALCAGIALVVSVIVSITTGAIRYTGYFVRESTAVVALSSHGFTKINVVKRNCSFLWWRGASPEDSVRFTCTATNPAGQNVTMYVYAGPLKGATIRTP